MMIEVALYVLEVALYVLVAWWIGWEMGQANVSSAIDEELRCLLRDARELDAPCARCGIAEAARVSPDGPHYALCEQCASEQIQ
jgi:hypothetical protein